METKPPSSCVGKGWGGGSGEGDGQFVPSETAARQPRWLRNHITSSDYPLVARREGKDGRVTLSVLIDRDGRVVDARVLEGAYDALNAAALRGVRRAVFSPAYDAQGRPVACRLTLPIRFELR
jgi:periplasmic protein TonB